MNAVVADAVPDLWREAWPKALASWSRFTRLQDPRLCASRVEAAREGLSGSFAMIRLADKLVVVDLEQVQALGLESYAVEILAHEIGHHVLAPATAIDHVRLLARIRRALPTLEAHAPMVANLYADLLINDRLQRQVSLHMAEIYRAIARSAQTKTDDGVWSLYMGIYEELWALPTGDLGGPAQDSPARADAWLGSRLIRAYSGDWLDGGARFASLLLPYIVEATDDRRVKALMDTQHAAQGSEPAGATDVEPEEVTGAIHPALDPRVTGEPANATDTQGVQPPADPAAQSESTGGQTREPFEYGEILHAGGIALDDHEIAIRYYRERALSYLVPFPTQHQPDAEELHLEGIEPWEMGDPLDELDWMQTLLQSPTLVAGLTTVRRSLGPAPGSENADRSVDLDLYVDSSGSMPNPQVHTSYLALAGAIIAMSALRSGSRVQVTLWSGKQQVLHTNGFVRSEDAILRVLTGFFGGATAFPIHRLRDTYSTRSPAERAVHILHLSDDGITTMFQQDEHGGSGWTIAAHALEAARGGGTMALNLHQPLPDIASADCSIAWLRDLLRAREAGWMIHVVRDMSELLGFARAFSRMHYSPQQVLS